MATSPVIFVLSIAQESVTRTRSRADEAFVSVFPLFADHPVSRIDLYPKEVAQSDSRAARRCTFHVNTPKKQVRNCQVKRRDPAVLGSLPPLNASFVHRT